jgi:hypothetical protein
MKTFASTEQSKTKGTVVIIKKKQQPFFSPLKIQQKLNAGGSELIEMSASESYWTGGIKGHLHENPMAYHTVNNFGDTPLRYMLRIRNQGYCLLSLETRYEYGTTGLQHPWVALFEQRGKTGEVINGLPPHSSLHLRLFGEKDYTDPDQTWCEGTAEVILQK